MPVLPSLIVVALVVFFLFVIFYNISALDIFRSRISPRENFTSDAPKQYNVMSGKSTKIVVPPTSNKNVIVPPPDSVS